MLSGRKDLIKKAPFCAYTGKFFSKNFKPSIEHVIPKSAQGPSTLFNYMAVEKFTNCERSNMPLDTWFQLHPDYAKNVQTYLDFFRKIDNGYVEGLLRTLRKACTTISFKRRLDIMA
jgi:hypothetical protein